MHPTPKTCHSRLVKTKKVGQRGLRHVVEICGNPKGALITRDIKIFDIRGQILAFEPLPSPSKPFHPYRWQRKKVLCQFSQPGIQLTSQHLAKYHRPRCVDLCFPLITLLIALHLPSHFENICQLECSEAVK